MKLAHYPDGNKPECNGAGCLIFTAESYGQEQAPEAFTVPQTHRLQLFSGTPGCSISFTLDEGEDSFWRIYTTPLNLAAGDHRLRTKVSRIGYHNSEEKVFEITVEGT